jgi:regulator of protease activity HflC (stomatin/prohibitin superfamily)
MHAYNATKAMNAQNENLTSEAEARAGAALRAAEADAKSEVIRAEARAKAAILQAEAEANGTRLRAQAEADRIKLLAATPLGSKLAELELYVKALTSALSSANVVYLPPDAVRSPFSFFGRDLGLPLPNDQDVKT